MHSALNRRTSTKDQTIDQPSMLVSRHGVAYSPATAHTHPLQSAFHYTLRTLPTRCTPPTNTAKIAAAPHSPPLSNSMTDRNSIECRRTILRSTTDAPNTLNKHLQQQQQQPTNGIAAKNDASCSAINQAPMMFGMSGRSQRTVVVGQLLRMSVLMFTVLAVCTLSTAVDGQVLPMRDVVSRGDGGGEIFAPRSLLTAHEPSCEELRAMWRFSKRQSRAAEMTNELPTFRDPFHFNVWEPYYGSTRSTAGMKVGGRYRYDIGRPIFGRVLHREPVRYDGLVDRGRTFHDMTRFYNPLIQGSKVQQAARKYVPQQQFRFGGTTVGNSAGTAAAAAGTGGTAAVGGVGANTILPQKGSFQRLKEMVWTERMRELQNQRKIEEMAARSAVLKHITNGDGFGFRQLPPGSPNLSGDLDPASQQQQTIDAMSPLLRHGYDSDVLPPIASLRMAAKPIVDEQRALLRSLTGSPKVNLPETASSSHSNSHNNNNNDDGQYGYVEKSPGHRMPNANSQGWPATVQQPNQMWNPQVAAGRMRDRLLQQQQQQQDGGGGQQKQRHQHSSAAGGTYLVPMPGALRRQAAFAGDTDDNLDDMEMSAGLGGGPSSAYMASDRLNGEDLAAIDTFIRDIEYGF